MKTRLDEHTFHGGIVSGYQTGDCRLILPRGDDQHYCLAQLDDYMPYSRPGFPHSAPSRIEVEAKVSGEDMSGTWGFGLWNDPFSVGLLAGGASRILPVLPNAAWFFYASPENHLSLYDGLPGSGFLARTYRSPLLPGILDLFTLFLLPFVVSKKGRRFLRRRARHFVEEDGKHLDVDVCEWHTYSLDWQKNEVAFLVDGMEVFRTPVSPRGHLGFVLWIDNQYFRFDATGRMAFGFLGIPDEQSLHLRRFEISSS